MLSSCKIATKWYPFGMLAQNYNAKSYRFGFNGHEKENEVYGEGNYWSFGDYGYDARISQRWTADPVIKEWESSYAVFANNPVWLVDPTGLDTVDIEYNAKKEKWNITNTQIAKGDDVFRVKIGDEIKTYVFDEGEYGKRINALNLETNDEYTLGVYQASGTDDVYGFYIVPGGNPSVNKNSGKRLPDGIYSLKGHTFADNLDAFRWIQPKFTSKEYTTVEERGIAIHPSGPTKLTWTNARQWTDGCYVVASDYRMVSNNIQFKYWDSLHQSIKLNQWLGMEYFFYNIGKKKRPGAIFPDDQLGVTVIQKSLFDNTLK